MALPCTAELLMARTFLLLVQALLDPVKWSWRSVETVHGFLGNGKRKMEVEIPVTGWERPAMHLPGLRGQAAGTTLSPHGTHCSILLSWRKKFSHGVF